MQAHFTVALESNLNPIRRMLMMMIFALVSLLHLGFPGSAPTEERGESPRMFHAGVSQPALDGSPSLHRIQFAPSPSGPSGMTPAAPSAPPSGGGVTAGPSTAPGVSAPAPMHSPSQGMPHPAFPTEQMGQQTPGGVMNPPGAPIHPPVEAIVPGPGQPTGPQTHPGLAPRYPSSEYEPLPGSRVQRTPGGVMSPQGPSVHPPVENLVPRSAAPVAPRFPTDGQTVAPAVTYYGDPESPPMDTPHLMGEPHLQDHTVRGQGQENGIGHEINREEPPLETNAGNDEADAAGQNDSGHTSENDVHGGRSVHLEGEPARGGEPAAAAPQRHFESFAPSDIPHDGQPVLTNEDLERGRQSGFSQTPPAVDQAGPSPAASQKLEGTDPDAPLEFGDSELEEFMRIPSRGFSAEPASVEAKDTQATDTVAATDAPLFTNEDLEDIDRVRARGFGYGADSLGEEAPTLYTNEDLEALQQTEPAAATRRPMEPAPIPEKTVQMPGTAPDKHVTITQPPPVPRERSWPPYFDPYETYSAWGDWPPLEPHIPGMLRGGEGGIRGDGYIPPRGRPEPPQRIIVEIPPPTPWQGIHPDAPDALDLSRSP